MYCIDFYQLKLLFIGKKDNVCIKKLKYSQINALLKHNTIEIDGTMNNNVPIAVSFGLK